MPLYTLNLCLGMQKIPSSHSPPPTFHSTKLVHFLVCLTQMYIKCPLPSQCLYNAPKFLKTYKNPFWYWV